MSALCTAGMVAALLLAAQDQGGAPPAQPGRVAGSSVGQAGQRLGREQASGRVQPTARIDGRINNRVQNRVRNRIDRTYDPQANAADPFAAAQDQARTRPRS